MERFQCSVLRVRNPQGRKKRGGEPKRNAKRSFTFSSIAQSVEQCMICNRKGANQGKEKLNRILIRNSLILDSSMVEHSAVNRVVVGSSPTRGVGKSP